MQYPSLAHTVLATSAIALCATTLSAQTQSDSDRVAQLEQRLANLEQQLSSSGPDFTFGSGSQTSVDFYGYLKADFIYDFDAELGNTTFPLAFSSTEYDTDDNYFNATAQQTRLGLQTTTSTDVGELGTRLEIGFYGGDGAFGTADPYDPRVRRAYAELGNVLIGKEWTTFMPLLSYPSTLDFQGVAGIPFARQEMVRYTQPFADVMRAEVAIEESNGMSDQPVGVAAIAYDTDPVLVRLSGIAGRAENGNGDEDDMYGVNLSTTLGLWQGATLDAAYTYGEAIASYLVFLGEDIDADGEAIEAQAAYAGVTQSVGDRLTLRAIYGWRENDKNGISDTYEFERLSSVHLNAEYTLVENVTVGAEYYHGTVDPFGGSREEVDRIQTSFQVTF